LTDEQRALRSTIREFAESEIAPHADAWDQAERIPVESIRRLGDLGVMGLAFPEDYGGVGAGTLAFVIAIEELARIDSSTAITVGASVSLGGGPIYLFGSEEQKQRWLVPLARGETLGAFGTTEPSGGSDVQAMTTTARTSGDDLIINGTKAFITNAGTEISSFVTIVAISGDNPREYSNVLIPTGTPGYSVGRPYRKIGWHASDTRELIFEDCRVPAGNIVGTRGRGVAQFLEVLDGGRIGVAALSLGLAQGCLDLSLGYAKQRLAFGSPIGRKQAIQFRLAELATEIGAARLLTYKAAASRDAGRRITMEAAMAKLFASEVAVRAADAAVQIHGGLGFIEETAVARHYRDAKILTIGEGTSEIQKLVIGRGLGLASDD
ncbi:MAG TPA: acyl-CoA dehydrogenase family protein, partial [Chloroflexota bacterium]|nr:acyl-CoA dehydrogenase family protein [Chloroflexota bacterium]